MKHYLVWFCMIAGFFLSGCASPTPSPQPQTAPSRQADEKMTPEQAATIARFEQFFGQSSEAVPQRTESSENEQPSESAPEAIAAINQGVAFQAREVQRDFQTPELEQPLMQDDAGTVGLNFDNADIYDVTKVVSEITGKSFIIDEDVKGSVTIFTQMGMTPDQIFELYKTVLDLNGMEIVQVGNFYKIQAKEGKPSDKLGSLTNLAGDDESLVTQVVKLRYIRAEDAKKALEELVPEGKKVLVYPDTVRDTLIITDRAVNVRKMLAVLEQIDVSEYNSQYFQIFPIQHADLADLVNDLIQILSLRDVTDQAAISPTPTPAPTTQNQGEEATQTQTVQQPTAQSTETETTLPVSQLLRPGTKTRIYPIKRLNALAVSTNQPDVIKLVEQWVSILDQPPADPFAVEEDPDKPKTYFYPVQYSKASDLALILAQVYDETYQAPQQTTTNQQQNQQQDQQQNRDQYYYQDQNQQPTSTLPSSQRFGNKVVFTTDNTNNTLIIKATPLQYAEIQDLLEKLDKRPLQVLIDVIIAEVQLNDADVFGVQGMVLGEGQVTIGGETNAVETTTSTVFQNIMPTNSEGFMFVASAPGRFLMQLRALATENRLKVLSDPHILVRHNEEATINVGDEIPISETTGTGDNVQQNVKYRTTGIKLKVKPMINTRGDVVIKISQEVSDVGQESFGDTGAASFTTRNAETSVVTQDNHPLIMGGLIADRVVSSEQGVPLMKDIPLLGKLFRYNEQRTRRAELIILVTPRVVKDQDEGWTMTENILNDRIKDLEKFFNREETDADRIKRYLKLP